jgi:hypothetical protein
MFQLGFRVAQSRYGCWILIQCLFQSQLIQRSSLSICSPINNFLILFMLSLYFHSICPGRTNSVFVGKSHLLVGYEISIPGFIPLEHLMEFLLNYIHRELSLNSFIRVAGAPGNTNVKLKTAKRTENSIRRIIAGRHLDSVINNISIFRIRQVVVLMMPLIFYVILLL